MEKAIIISGSIFGSVVIFSISLNCINDIILRRNSLHNSLDENNLNKLIFINGITMIFSGAAFSYFTYNGIK